MRISIIAACDKNNLIGTGGKIPWHIPEDLKRFKEITDGHAVIMGRGTFDSLDRKPLPNRFNVVITSNEGFGRNRDGALFVNSHEDALKACAMSFYYEVYVIGGESVYRDAMDYADRILLTRVDNEYCPGFANDVRHFPAIGDDFKLESTEQCNNDKIRFEVYTK